MKKLEKLLNIFNYLIFMLTAGLIFCKISGLLSISWIWVFSPVWISLILAGMLFMVILSLVVWVNENSDLGAKAAQKTRQYKRFSRK